jgi:hypothetical protein
LNNPKSNAKGGKNELNEVIVKFEEKFLLNVKKKRHDNINCKNVVAYKLNN